MLCSDPPALWWGSPEPPQRRGLNAPPLSFLCPGWGSQCVACCGVHTCSRSDAAFTCHTILCPSSRALCTASASSDGSRGTLTKAEAQLMVPLRQAQHPPPPESNRATHSDRSCHKDLPCTMIPGTYGR